MSAVQDVLDKWGEVLVDRIVKKLQSGNKVATGSLINSITYKYSYSNGKYTIQITGNPYLIFVDRGRRPGAKQPPIIPLIAWIKAKRIPIGLGKQKTLVKKGKQAPKDKQIRGMAYAIAKNISKRGIKPFPILNEANVLLKSAAFKNDLAAALKKDVAPVILKIFKK